MDTSNSDGHSTLVDPPSRQCGGVVWGGEDNYSIGFAEVSL